MKWLFLLFPFYCGGQKVFTVQYKDHEHYLPFTFQGEAKKLTQLVGKLVYNDSISLFYMVNDYDRLGKKKTYNQKLIHLSLFYNLSNRLIFRAIAWPASKKKYLIKDTIKTLEWTFLNSSKEILGYTCNSALHVSNENDSILVWYTTAIPNSFGPVNYVGFPGLVLEVTNQRTHQYFIATKIEEEEKSLTFPIGIEIVSLSEYLRRQPNKKIMKMK